MAKVIFICFFIFEAILQNSAFCQRGTSNPHIFGVTGGIDFLNDQSTNHWLQKNGFNAASTFRPHIGFKALLPAARATTNIMIGFEINESFSNSPHRNDATIELLMGYKIEAAKVNLIPCLGMGVINSYITFPRDTPIPLLQISKQGGNLSQNAMLLDPHIVIHKSVGPRNFKIYAVAVEAGYKIYTLRENWWFMENGNNSKTQLNFIPTRGIGVPYITILVGWNY